MTNSNYELRIKKEVLYALASLCVATYVDAGVDRRKIPEQVMRRQQWFLKFMAKIGRTIAFIPRKTFSLFRKPLPAKNVSDLITDDTERQVLRKFEEPFTKLGWKMPSASDINLINHRYLKGDEARLGGFAITTENYIAVAFRGTAYSEEWVANLSYGVPAVKNVRHVAGVTTLSLLPFLKRSKLLEKIFDLKTAKFLNAGYLQHVDSMVRHNKEFLDGVMRANQANSSLKSRPLYFTGHSLGGAAAIIVSREVFEDAKRPYKSWFGSRIITLTFGAPPISGRQVIAQPEDPPVYNLLRPGDIVPSASIDVLGIPL